MNMHFKRNRFGSDLEKGPSKELGSEEQQMEGEFTANGIGEQATSDDDSDSNDKFWKMFQEEAAEEVQWKVDIWKTDLDSLLVFAGLFAAVVSAFLIDLRFHLRPDPQLIALNNIASILHNDTNPPEQEHAPPVVHGVGFLWYGSLVATLIGALWGVLAKGWLGELLREPPNNPADRALERWRRDMAARKWHMEHVITGVPLLIQVGLAMFLSGFVVQSFDDNRGIGILVLVYVALGAIAYAVFTCLPWYSSDCPYRTPLTNLFNLHSAIAPKAATHDENTRYKIQILVSRLNRSSNDDIFTSAASVLDAKLESPDSKTWFEGVENHASEIADAFSVRLKSFAHRVQTVKEGPSLSIIKDSVNYSGSMNPEAFTGTLYSPIEQGITCLRVLLKSIEASITYKGDQMPWIKHDIDRHWRSSHIYPATWRLLSLSIHVTKLVAKEADYTEDDPTELDWKSLIGTTFSDHTLRSISGASACRGLLHGRPNLKRVCALGLAMYIETAVSLPADSAKTIFFDNGADGEVDLTGRVITSSLWVELENIWKNAAVHLVCKFRSESEDEQGFKTLLDHQFYQQNIQTHISGTIMTHLDDSNWTTRKQGIHILTKLAEHDAFLEAIWTSGSIQKVITMFEDDDEDVRAAAIRALSAFSARYLETFPEIMTTENGITKLVKKLTDKDSDVRVAAGDVLLAFGIRGGPLTPTDGPRWNSIAKIYHPNIKSSIPTIMMLLDHFNWRIREQAIQILHQLNKLDTFQEVLVKEGLMNKLVAKLIDEDSDVRAAAVSGVLEIGIRDPYQENTKSLIPTILPLLDNNNWEIREKAVKILIRFSEFEVFRNVICLEGLVLKLVNRLEDDDEDVRKAVVLALHICYTQEIYQPDIKESTSAIIHQLHHTRWTVRLEAIDMLSTLSENDIFHEPLKSNGAFTELVTCLNDDDEDVRAATIRALLTFGAQSYFMENVDSAAVVTSLFSKLSDNSRKVRSGAIRALSILSSNDIYSKDIKSLVILPDLVKQLDNESWSTREQAVEILAHFATNSEFHAAMYTEKTIAALIKILEKDRDEDVRTAAAQALSMFGTYDYFQKPFKTEKVILKLTGKLADSYPGVRSAVQATLLSLSSQDRHVSDIRSVIPLMARQLDDKNWATRQQAIVMLTGLCKSSKFQETMKTEMVIAKLTVKLTDRDGDVVVAAAKALATLATNGLFLDRMKSEETVSQLIAKLSDSMQSISQAATDALLALGKRANAAEFLAQVITSLVLNTKEREQRMPVYCMLKLLKASWNESYFFKEFDLVIYKLLTQMQRNDGAYIYQSIAIMAEAVGEGLTSPEFQTPSNANKSSRDAVESIISDSKLTYVKGSPDQHAVVLALSQLATNKAFLGCLKLTISGIVEAVNSADQNVWSAAVAAVEALSQQDEFRVDLVPAIDKLIQQLIGWDDDTQYPLNIVEAMTSLANYKEFQMRLKHVVGSLMNQLSEDKKDVRNDPPNQDQDANELSFYKASCKLVSKLCEKEAIGKDLVPHLTRALLVTNGSLAEDLHDLLGSLIKHGHLPMNDRIALASSLRITPIVPDDSTLQVWKLNMAAVLDDAHQRNDPPPDYNKFLGAVLGTGNDTVKSKISALIPQEMRGNPIEQDVVRIIL